MNIIGNIVSSKPIEYDKRINTVNSIDNITNNLPTLIIGYTITKDLHPDKIDFLTKKIEEDLFWTFTLQEKRKVHEIDIENFIQYCYENTIKDISYLFVDPIQFNTRTLKKVINKIYSLDKPVSFLYHDYVYIYGECIIFGIDLHLCEFFFGIKKDKIKNKSNDEIIKMLKIKTENKPKNINDRCYVCLDEPNLKYECNHLICLNCMIEWNINNDKQTCDLCKKPIEFDKMTLFKNQ